MPEIAWDIARVEAQAKKWQEMASVLANDHDRVAWLIEQISYLSALALPPRICLALMTATASPKAPGPSAP